MPLGPLLQWPRQGPPARDHRHTCIKSERFYGHAYLATGCEGRPRYVQSWCRAAKLDPRADYLSHN